METNAITELSSLLRENGDKVLSGQSKLSLMSSLLQSINEAFKLVLESNEECETSFHVLQNTNSDIEIVHDIQFLHDFVQKTVGLKLTHNIASKNTKENRIDLSKFRNLKYLEIRKMPIHCLYGIQSIRSHLQSVVCIRCVQELSDLLSDCGGDGSSGFPWSELREAVFSYNGISVLDHSLEFTPWLQILDLSHNKICNADAIDCLPNLKYLNISYNLLESVPSVNKDASRKLEVLVIKNNYIEDLTGLMSLENLLELDLSCNCLTDHHSLGPLLHLSSLITLSLEGNPLSFHPQHRLRTAYHLHNSSASGKFMLDRIPLSKSERLAVGSHRDTATSQRAAFQNDRSSPSNSVSEHSNQKNDIGHHMTKSLSSQSIKKSGRVREAQIIEQEGYLSEEYDDLSASIKTGSIDLSTDHLETKKKIEVLREKFGKENWLHSQGGSCVQDVLGLHKHHPTVQCSSRESAFSSSKQNIFPPVTSKVVEVAENGTTDFGAHMVIHTAEVSVHVSADTLSEDDAEYQALQSSSEKGEQVVDHAKEEDEEEESSAIDEEEEDDGEEDLYLVQKKKRDSEDVEELFLVVTERFLKEREALCGKTHEKWIIASLLSCVKIGGQHPLAEVQLTFDTVRRDRQERVYLMDDKDAQKLLKILGEVLEARPLTAMNQAAFRCMKCSAQFSYEISSVSAGLQGKTLVCPTCKSKMVIQMDEVPLPFYHTEVQSKENEAKTSEITSSPSQSSIGAEAGVTSGRDRLQVTALIHQTEALQPPPCSATSLQSYEECPNNMVGHVRRWDSDIEILSNPSQSSIEVLDEQGRQSSITPARKRSSEERQTATATNPVHEPPTNVHENESNLFSLTGLTESSSSGSLTDSICTTYEICATPSPYQKNKIEDGESEIQKNVHCKNSLEGTFHLNTENGTQGRPSQDMEAPLYQEESSAYMYRLNEKNKCNRTDYTTMLQGLLQSVGSKIISNPSGEGEEIVAKETHIPENTVKYSYTNFSTVDHRVKLHLYVHLFQQEHEELLFLLRAQVVPQPPSRPFPGCLVLSTRNIYILEITDVEGDDPEHWLSKVGSYATSTLLLMFVLPWFQGIGIDLLPEPEDSAIRYLFILYDINHTKNFLSYIKSITSLNNCRLLEEPFESQTLALQQLILSVAAGDEMDPTINLFTILSDCCFNRAEETCNIGMTAIIITTSNLVLMGSNMAWLFPQSTEALKPYSVQHMSNLIEMEIIGKCSMILQFLDEAAASDESWLITVGTESALQSVITTIKTPWEQLFSVPLQIINKTVL